VPAEGRRSASGCAAPLSVLEYSRTAGLPFRYQYLDEHTLDEFKKEIGLLSQAHPPARHRHRQRSADNQPLS
jgi:hypothetical protein